MSNPGKGGLEGYWKLDEASGATRYDAHKSTTMSDVNGVNSIGGVLGNCAVFASSNSEALVANSNANVSFADDPMTLGGWYRPGRVGYTQALMGKDDRTGAGEGYLLWLDSATDYIRWTVSGDGTADTDVSASTFGALSLATWYFFMASHNPATNLLSVSVNAGTPNTVAHTTGIYESAARFIIGARDDGSGETANADGRIDELFLYRKILSQANATWLYNAGVGRTYEDLLDGGVPVAMTPTLYL